MDVADVGRAVLYMAGLPLDANVQFMTIMATKMPFIGRGLSAARFDPKTVGPLLYCGYAMTATESALAPQLEKFRVELTGYCYRMLGSAFEAEDAVQETMVRAWRALDRFEGRSSLRSWLYRIATNVCLDMLRRPRNGGPGRWTSARPRRPRPSPLGARCPSTPGCSRSPTRGAARRRRPGRRGGGHGRRSGSPSSPRCSTCRPGSARC